MHSRDGNDDGNDDDVHLCVRQCDATVPVRIHVVSHAHEPALELCNESVYCVVSLHEANVAVGIACVRRVSGALASWVRHTDGDSASLLHESASTDHAS